MLCVDESTTVFSMLLDVYIHVEFILTPVLFYQFMGNVASINPNSTVLIIIIRIQKVKYQPLSIRTTEWICQVIDLSLCVHCPAVACQDAAYKVPYIKTFKQHPYNLYMNFHKNESYIIMHKVPLRGKIKTTGCQQLESDFKKITFKSLEVYLLVQWFIFHFCWIIMHIGIFLFASRQSVSLTGPCHLNILGDCMQSLRGGDCV